MLTSQYLYQIHPKELDDKLYYEALAFKLKCGLNLHGRLYWIPRRSYQESVRMFFVEKAIKHTQDLLNEKDEQE